MTASALRALLIVAAVVPVLAGCATRQASVENTSTYAAALPRDVAEPARQFPYGPAPVLYGMAGFVPLSAPESEIHTR